MYDIDLLRTYLMIVYRHASRVKSRWACANIARSMGVQERSPHQAGCHETGNS
jgi:hypothetical protein